MDSRAATGPYHDLAPDSTPDNPCYLQHVPGAQSSVLEPGCGIGRVTVPLASAGDITQLRLQARFDLILTPYRAYGEIGRIP